jgi:flagellar biosynthesis chaperone FliJ
VKRYRFRLEGVRRVRQVQQDQAAAELGGAVQASLRAERDATDRRAALAARTIAPGPSRADSLVAGIVVREAASRSVKEAMAARAVAAARVSELRDAWALTAQRVAALDALDERRRAEHDVAQRRWEANLVDDLVTSRHQRDEEDPR